MFGRLCHYYFEKIWSQEGQMDIDIIFVGNPQKWSPDDLQNQILGNQISRIVTRLIPWSQMKLSIEHQLYNEQNSKLIIFKYFRLFLGFFDDLFDVFGDSGKDSQRHIYWIEITPIL